MFHQGEQPFREAYLCKTLETFRLTLLLIDAPQRLSFPAVREAADDALTELLSLEMGIEDDHFE